MLKSNHILDIIHFVRIISKKEKSPLSSFKIISLIFDFVFSLDPRRNFFRFGETARPSRRRIAILALYRALYPPQCERCIYAWGARPNQIYGRHFCVKTLLRSFFVSERRISCSLIINDSKDGKDFPLSTCNLIKNWLMLQQTLHRKLKI